MSTYLISHLRIPGDVPNEEALSYLEQVESTVEPYGGRWLANGPVTVVEGAWPGALVIIEFPDRGTVEQWYNSPAYQQILPLRTRNVVSDLVLIDSVPDDYSVKAFARRLRATLAAESDA